MKRLTYVTNRRLGKDMDRFDKLRGILPDQALNNIMNTRVNLALFVRLMK